MTMTNRKKYITVLIASLLVVVCLAVLVQFFVATISVRGYFSDLHQIPRYGALIAKIAPTTQGNVHLTDTGRGDAWVRIYGRCAQEDFMSLTSRKNWHIENEIGDSLCHDWTLFSQSSCPFVKNDVFVHGAAVDEGRHVTASAVYSITNSLYLIRMHIDNRSNEAAAK